VTSTRPRILIDGRLFTGTTGGVETVLIGLAQGLASVPFADLDISFVTYEGHDGWLRPHVGAGVSIVTVPPPRRATPGVRKLLGPAFGPLRRVRRAIRRTNTRIPTDLVMDGLAADLVHFPHQGPGRITAPFIYQPHDLQHLHLPQFFTPEELRRRETYYGPLCRAAARVVVGTSWVKSDIIDNYGVDASHINVIPLAPVAGAGHPGVRPPWLPANYLLYPAAFWPHKNHARLIEALALTATDHPDVELVLTGAAVADGTDVVAAAATFGVASRVHLAGFLSEDDLATAYAHARAVVVPTLFEAGSFPIWEAFSRGIPVACSTVTSLPRQVGDAAVLFDPLSVPAIAAAISLVWSDDALRATLVAKGSARVAAFSWEDTARRYVALYRLLTSVATEADERLLAEEPKI
jgi:glycosyltransferase involved in cell wall biosynthesis